MFLFSFYLDDSDENNQKIKWRSLPIYDLRKIYRKLELSKVLDYEYDVRNTPIEELSVAQLKYECENRGIDASGYKVIEDNFIITDYAIKTFNNLAKICKQVN